MPSLVVIPEDRKYECDVCKMSGSHQQTLLCEVYHNLPKMQHIALGKQNEYFGLYPLLTPGGERGAGERAPRAVRISRNSSAERWYVHSHADAHHLGSLTNEDVLTNFCPYLPARPLFWKRTMDHYQNKLDRVQAEIAVVENQFKETEKIYLLCAHELNELS